MCHSYPISDSPSIWQDWRSFEKKYQLFSANVVQTIAVTETLVTFFIPFALTVLTDISVLIMYRPCQPTFTLIPKEDVGGDLCNSSYLKIVSKKNIEDWTQKRHVAIRRCLLMATINLFLTLPNYSLQVRQRDVTLCLLVFLFLLCLPTSRPVCSYVSQ